MKRFNLVVLCSSALLVLALLWARPLSRATLPPRVTLTPFQLMANGYDSATLTIDEPSPNAPAITIEPAHGATVRDLSVAEHGWQAQIRAGVIPGIVTVRVHVPGRPPSIARLVTDFDAADSAGDGTPDFLRLDDPDDQRAFRRWFTFLAETQYFEPAERRPAEIVDCAALHRIISPQRFMPGPVYRDPPPARGRTRGPPTPHLRSPVPAT